MTINLINGKIYFGKHKTKKLNDKYLGSGILLKKAIKKYGQENFKKFILFFCNSEEEMDKWEKFLVNDFTTESKHFYNVNHGGTGGFSYLNKTRKNIYGNNGKHPKSLKNLEKGRRKIKKILSNPLEKEKYCNKIRNIISNLHKENKIKGFLGRKHREETKKIIGLKNSFKQKGENNSQYGTRWIYHLETGINKKLKKGEDLPEGWSYGRKIENF